MLSILDLRIIVLKLFWHLFLSVYITVVLLLKSVLIVNDSIVRSIDLAEHALDWFFELQIVKSIFRFRFVQYLSVFVVLSVLMYGFLIKVTDALVIESQARFISEQKFEAQLDSDTPDDIFFSKKERLNE